MSYAALDGSHTDTTPPPPVSESNGSVQLLDRISSSTVSLASSRRQRRQVDDVDATPLAEDPYHVFRKELVSQLELVDRNVADYLRVVHETDTAVNTVEFKDTKRLLKRSMKQAEATLRDVQTAAQLAESTSERTAFCTSAQARLKRAAQESIQSAVTKQKIANDQHALQLRRSTGTATGTGAGGSQLDTAVARNNNRANGHEGNSSSSNHEAAQQTSLLMQHQDETLDELGLAVERVGEYAGAIHEEIGQQTAMLDDLADDLDNVEEELGLVMGRLARFLGTRDRWQLGTILTLSAIMIVLLMLVIYT